MSEKTMWLGFAVNDDNGETRGGIRVADFGCDWLHIEHVDGRPTGFKQLANKRVRIGRRIFPYVAYQSWHGNMCWEGVKVCVETAQQIAEYLRDTGKYQPDMGVLTVWEAWDANQPIVFEEHDDER